MHHPVCGLENLHVHSHHSLLDGFARCDEYAERLPQINQKYLCLTDHGVMGGVPDQIRECDKHGLYPVFGVEAYISQMQPEVETRSQSAEFRKNLPEDLQKKFDKSCHLTLIARDNTGYSNLVRMSSWGWIHGFYRRPRINHEILNRYKEGVTVLSGCANSEIANAFFDGGEEAGFEMLEKYIQMFSPHLYLEIMMLDFQPQKPYDAFLIKCHLKYGVPLVWTGDCHYCLPSHSHNQRLMLMQKNKRTIQEIEAMIESDEAEDLFELQDQNLWLKSEEEVNVKWESDYQFIDYELFKQAKANTVKICEAAKGVQLDREIKLPKIPDAEVVLWDEICKGFTLRHCPDTTLYRNRIRDEYDLICEKGFASYFLIQKEFTDEARRCGPELLGFGDGSDVVGPGRGCLSPETKVRIADGLVIPIGEVKEKHKVYTIDGSLQKVNKVLRYELKNEPMLKIKTYYGDASGVVLTNDHKVYAEKCVHLIGWKNWSESTRKARKGCDPIGNLDWFRADELLVGDWCFVPIPQVESQENTEIDLSVSSVSLSNGKKLYSDEFFVYHEFNSKLGGRVVRVCPRFWRLDEQWAVVLGFFAGDGWTRSANVPQVGFCESADSRRNLLFVEQIFRSIGCDTTWYYNQNDKNVDQLIVRSYYMRRLFDLLHPLYQHTSTTKHVPECILYAPTNIVWAYLNGYFLADGHEGENKAKFETVSPILAEQIRFLLLRVGLPSSLGVDKRSDVRQEFSGRKTSYRVVCPLSKNIGCRRDTQTKYVWRSVPGGILLRIREITKEVGVKEVIDLEVDNNHNFLTNSFLVHNSVCGFLSAYCLRLHDVDPIVHDLRASRFLSPARGGKQMRTQHTLSPIPHEEVKL